MKKTIYKKITALFLVFLLCLVFVAACKKNAGQQSEPLTVMLAQSEISVGTGESYILEANVHDATWSTDNAAVARVDVRGKVTGVSEGTALIVAEKGGSQASCTVTVTQKKEQEPVYSVKTAARELTIEAGKTAKLNAFLFVNGKPAEEKIVYSSLNETVAEVDQSGTVTAVTAGNATISASYGKARALVNVTVYDVGTTLSLSSKAIEVLLGQTATITAITASGTDNVAWYASDEKISVDGGVVTGRELGESVVTARFGGLEERCRVTVYDVKNVSTVEDFTAMRNNKYIRYEMSDDIDFSEYEWSQNNIITEFSSQFNGHGKKITGLKYENGGRWIGIFGTLTQSAVIENLALYIDKFDYESDCGILALNNHGTVKNCYFYTKQHNSNADAAVRLRSGIIRDNYGTISGVIVEPHNLTGGNIDARIHALAGLNAGSISSVIVVSAANPAFSNSGKYWCMHQMISGAAGGYADNYKPENSADTRRTDSVIFKSVSELFSKNGIRGDASLIEIKSTSDADIKSGIDSAGLTTTGEEVIATFDDVWAFTDDSITLCDTPIYNK